MGRGQITTQAAYNSPHMVALAQCLFSVVHWRLTHPPWPGFERGSPAPGGHDDADGDEAEGDEDEPADETQPEQQKRCVGLRAGD